MRRALWLILSTTLALAAVAELGCGGEESPEDPGPIHVHGLGLNPADDALFIATHTGLYRTPEGERHPERVGERYQDTMGFTVVGADHFLGSGHPDAEGFRKGDPPLLGLIESRDAGETWRPISLRGEADFHVLRFLGERVYGFDASNNRLLVSTEGGRTWRERRIPAPLIDLAADPRRRGHLLATTARALFRSEDDGRTWHVLRGKPGLLAWPLHGALYVIDGAGVVRASGDAGARFTRRGEIGGEPAAVTAAGERELYVALHDGTIKVSIDGGRNWAVRSTP